MIEFLIRFFSVFFLYFLLLLFPFSAYQPQSEMKMNFFHSLESEKNFFAQTNENQTIAFVKRVRHEKGGSHYSVRLLGDDGRLLRQFALPPQKEIQNTRLGDGFLTYPDDGSLFIWYPRLGRKIFYFDNEGRFLWELENTQYLKLFPSGRWLLTAAGDHSRFQIRLPNLETVADVEGMIFTDTHFTKQEELDESYQACSGFLNGDVVFIRLSNGAQQPVENVVRIEKQKLLKSLACNFSQNLFAVQLENKKDTITDAIYLYKMPQKSFEKNELLFQFSLPDYYPYKLPLSISQSANAVSFLLPAVNELAQIIVLDKKGKPHFQMQIEKQNQRENFDADDWRVETLADYFIFWNQHSVYVVGLKGLIFTKDFSAIRAVKVVNNNLYVDSNKGIFSYGLR